MTPPTKIEQKYKGVRRILRRKLKPEKVKSAKIQKVRYNDYNPFSVGRCNNSIYESNYSGGIKIKWY